MKIGSVHDVKLISVEPYGCEIVQYGLKEKLEMLKSCLKIKNLSNKQETKCDEKKESAPYEIEAILVNT